MIKINIFENQEKTKNINKVATNEITKQKKKRTHKYKNI